MSDVKDNVFITYKNGNIVGLDDLNNVPDAQHVVEIRISQLVIHTNEIFWPFPLLVRLTGNSPDIQTTNLSWMFENAIFFKGGISQWNTEKVETMAYMFSGAKVFNDDLSEWNTAKVKEMQYMFRATKLFNCDLTNWNTDNVTNMQCMFYLATFTCKLSVWTISNVANIKSMFEGVVLC